MIIPVVFVAVALWLIVVGIWSASHSRKHIEAIPAGLFILVVLVFVFDLVYSDTRSFADDFSVLQEGAPAIIYASRSSDRAIVIGSASSLKRIRDANERLLRLQAIRKNAWCGFLISSEVDGLQPIKLDVEAESK